MVGGVGLQSPGPAVRWGGWVFSTALTLPSGSLAFFSWEFHERLWAPDLGISMPALFICSTRCLILAVSRGFTCALTAFRKMSGCRLLRFAYASTLLSVKANLRGQPYSLIPKHFLFCQLTFLTLTLISVIPGMYISLYFNSTF